ncbi:MAG: cobalamin-dependent protein [Sporomusaceae bacterium]|nr:cobalamin-dependent protein [Sporomusaceae bacterium]
MESLAVVDVSLPKISIVSKQFYEVARYSVFLKTREQLEKHPMLDQLIGRQTEQRPLMYEILHRFNAILLVYCHFANQKMLLEQISWLYGTYQARGFAYEYFPLLFQSLEKALLERSGNRCMVDLAQLLQQLTMYHSFFIEASQTSKEQDENKLIAKKFTIPELADILLSKDFSQALPVFQTARAEYDSLLDFYEEIVKTVMYYIGRQWQQGKISAAQEHIATASASQVMAVLFARAMLETLPSAETVRPRAVIFATAKEYHELGAKMAADILFLKGWDVTFMGSNVPSRDVEGVLRQIEPKLLGISVTLSDHLPDTKQIITSLRKDRAFDNIKVLVGGAAFGALPRETVKHLFGADEYMTDLHDLTLYADQLYGLTNSNNIK